MKALIKVGQNISVQKTQVPEINSDEVLIRVALSGLCRTDVYVAQGIVKSKDP